MRKLFSAVAVCALAVGLTAAPAGIAKKKKGPAPPKLVGGTVSVFVAPNPAPSTATTVTVSGNVASNSNCRKDRTVRFAYISSMTGIAQPSAQTTVTGPNGDYSVALARPTVTPPLTLPQTFAVQATVDQQFRKVGSKKKGKKKKRGRQFNCLQITGQSIPVTFSAPPPAP